MKVQGQTFEIQKIEKNEFVLGFISEFLELFKGEVNK